MREDTDVVDLIRRCIERDNDAWIEFIRRYEAWIFKIAYKTMGRGTLDMWMGTRLRGGKISPHKKSDDFKGIVYERLLRVLPKYDPHKSKVTTWLKLVVRGAIIDEMRKPRLSEFRKKMRRDMYDRGDSLSSTGGGDDNEGQIVDPRNLAAMERISKPAETGVRRTAPRPEGPDYEKHARVRSAVRSLPSKHRRVLEMKFLEEMSYKEIARTEGVSEGTIGSRINAAKRILRDKYTPKMHPRAPKDWDRGGDWIERAFEEVLKRNSVDRENEENEPRSRIIG